MIMTRTAAGVPSIHPNRPMAGPVSFGPIAPVAVMLMIFIGAAVFPAMASAGIIRVDARVSTGGNGSTWATAYQNLNQAIAASVNGDEIWVAAGTYKPGSLRSSTFALKTGTRLRGGFAGTETDAAQRTDSGVITILSGEIGVDNDPSDDCHHVVTGAEGAILDRLFIKGGNANGVSFPDDSGGGLMAGPSGTASLEIQDCVFYANASRNGGGMYSRAALTVTRTVFSLNTASMDGGAINCGSAQVVLSDCLFCGNGSTGKGAAVAFTSSNGSMRNCTINSNAAAGQGSGLWAIGSVLTLNACIVWGNGLTSGNEIYNSGGTMTIMNSDVKGGVSAVAASGVVDGGGNLDSDPLFVSPTEPMGADGIFATLDDGLALGQSSPCLEKGSTEGASEKDLTGSARKQGAEVDMGSYERGSGDSARAVSVSSSSPDGIYRAATNVAVTVVFSEAVTVSGVPYLTLETGATDRQAPYSSGSGSTTLVFSYTVQSGDENHDLDYVSAAALGLPSGASIRGANGLSATLTLPAPGGAGSLGAAKAIVVDARAPQISSWALASGNSHIDVSISEGVYASQGASGPLVPADLKTVFLTNGGTATGVAIASLSTISGTPLTGGESTIRVNLSVTGVPSGVETFEVRPADSESIFDMAGNAMHPNATAGPVILDAGAARYSVSGLVTGTSGPMAGVTVEVLGVGRTLTGADGTFSFSGMTKGEYIAVPIAASYKFTPVYRGFTLTSTSSGIDFTAEAGASGIHVGGRVLQTVSGTTGTTPLGGATMTLAGRGTTTTNGNGFFIFTGLPQGTHTLTPSKDYYGFTPESSSITVSDHRLDLSFTGAYAGVLYTISGKVATSAGTPVMGVKLQIEAPPAGTGTAFSDTYGNYVIGSLPAGTYIVTPFREGYTFEPASSTVSVGPNQTGRNFSAAFNPRPPGFTGRYVKLVYSSFANATWFQLNEIKVFKVVSSRPGDLLAISAVAVSKPAHPGYGVEKLTDGMVVVNGDFALKNPGTSVSVTLDFGSDQEFHSLVTYNDGEYGAAKVQVQALATGGVWKSIGDFDLDVRAGQSNPDTIDFTGSLIVNEVSPGGISWIEIYNAGHTAIGLRDWTLTHDGGSWQFPDVSIEPAGYIVVHEGSGSASTGHLYTSSDLPWTLSGPGFATLSDGTGKVADFVKWNGSTKAAPAGSAFSDPIPALSASGYTLGRNSNSLDTDSGNDFFVEEPSQGARNTAPSEIEYFSITGSIHDSGGQPLEGATVEISSSVRTKTDSSGMFTFSSLRAGTFTVTPLKQDFTFEPPSTQVSVGPSASGVAFTGTLVTPPHLWSLGGTVYLNEYPNPAIEGVYVSVQPAGRYAITDQGGRYRFDDLTEGEYTVLASDISLEIRPSQKTVTLDRHRLEENFVAVFIEQTYSVSGQVRTSSGLAVSGATLELASSSGQTEKLLSGADGSYTFTGLKSGNYTLKPSKLHWEFNPASLSISSLSTNQTGKDFVADQPRYRVEGYVRDSMGGGVAGVDVVIGDAGTVQTDALGKYAMSTVLPGSYKVFPTLAGRTFTPQSTVISVGPDKTNLNFTMAAGGFSVRGVIISFGLPLSGVRVVFSNGGGEVTTGSDGVFVQPGLSMGRYVVTPVKEGYSFTPTSRTVDVSAEVAGQDFDGLSLKYKVLGHISTSQGLPVAGVSLSMGGLTVSSDSAGLYLFDGVASGRFTVTPSFPNYSFSPKSIDVAVGPDSSANDFVAVRSYGFTGTVRDLSGRVMEGVKVSLVPGGEVFTLAGGTFAFVNLVPGHYQAIPSKSGYAFTPASQEFDITNASTSFDFTGRFMDGTSILHVNASYSGSVENGTEEAPYRTVQAAVSVAASGSTVLVAPGSYTGTVVLKYGVRLSGSSPSDTILDIAGKTRGIQMAENTAVSGFTIRGGSALSGSAGIYSYGSSCTVARTVVTGCYDGITAIGSVMGLRNVTVVGNYGNSLSLSGGASATLGSSILDRIRTEGTGTSVTMAYSDLIQGGEATGTGAGNISVDPLFSDPVGGDFSLRSSSPCVDSGNPEASANDTDGTRCDMGAFGGPAEADSSLQFLPVISVSSSAGTYPGMGVERLVDGKVEYNSDYAARHDGKPVSLIADLGSENLVSSMTVSNDGNFGASAITLYAASASAADTWTMIAAFSGLVSRNLETVPNRFTFPSVRARYLKLYVTSPIDRTWLQFNEIEFRGVDLGGGIPASVKLAVTGPSCSPPAYPGYGVSKLFDGTRAFNGDFAVPHAGGDVRLEFSLASESALDRIELYNDAPYGAGTVKVYLAKAATPGVYSLQGSFPGLPNGQGDENRYAMRLNGVEAKYVRLVFSGHPDATWLQMNEIEVYGSPGTAATLYKYEITDVKSSQRGIISHPVDRLYDGLFEFNSDYAAVNPSVPVDIFVDLGTDVPVSEIHHVNDGQYGAVEVEISYSLGATPYNWVSLGRHDLDCTAGSANLDIIPIVPTILRNLRLRYSNLCTPGLLQLNELSVYGAAEPQSGRPSLGISSIATSRTPYAGMGVSALFNGTKVYNSEFAIKSPSGTIDLVVDLGTDAKVGGVKHHNDGAFGARSVEISFATAAGSGVFTTLATIGNLKTTPSRVNSNSLFFPGITARYIRFRYSEYMNPSWFQLSEYEIFGPPPASEGEPVDPIPATAAFKSGPAFVEEIGSACGRAECSKGFQPGGEVQFEPEIPKGEGLAPVGPDPVSMPAGHAPAAGDPAPRGFVVAVLVSGLAPGLEGVLETSDSSAASPHVVPSGLWREAVASAAASPWIPEGAMTLADSEPVFEIRGVLEPDTSACPAMLSLVTSSPRPDLVVLAVEGPVKNSEAFAAAVLASAGVPVLIMGDPGAVGSLEPISSACGCGFGGHHPRCPRFRSFMVIPVGSADRETVANLILLADDGGTLPQDDGLALPQRMQDFFAVAGIVAGDREPGDNVDADKVRAETLADVFSSAAAILEAGKGALEPEELTAVAETLVHPLADPGFAEWIRSRPDISPWVAAAFDELLRQAGR